MRISDWSSDVFSSDLGVRDQRLTDGRRQGVSRLRGIPGQLTPAGLAGSAVLVFPVAALALGQPFDRLCQSLRAGFLAPGFDKPVDVFVLLAGWKTLERRCGRLVLPQRCDKVVGCHRWRVRRSLGRSEEHTS